VSRPRKAERAWRARYDQALDYLMTARAYLDDGALLTCARNLREAADLFEEAAQLKDVALDAFLKRRADAEEPRS
jgi:TPR repeat protein